MVEKITDVLINLNCLKGSPNITMYNSATQHFAEEVFNSSMESGEFINMSVGKKIQKGFSRNDIFISNTIDRLVFSCDEKFFSQAGLDKYFLDFVLKSKCKLIHWKISEKSGNKIFEAEFKDINPYNLVGALVVAVKENSAALGKRSVLIDVESLEQVPQIAGYVAQHLQRKI